MAEKTEYDWEAIEQDYRTGRFSLRQLSMRHGPSASAIRNRSKKYEWKKDLTSAVKQRTREKVTRVSLPPEAQQVWDDDEGIVEFAANENAAVVKGHRVLLGKWRAIVDHYSERLVEQTSRGTITVQNSDGDVKEIDVPLEYVGKCLNYGTQALEKVVKLERQNYALDDDSDDAPPERALTDEELDAKIRELTEKLSGES